jgi:hypothetical protein
MVPGVLTPGVRGSTLWWVLALCLVLVLVAGPALAHVKDWYEWCNDPATGKPKRTLKVWVDPAAGAQMQQWTQQAIDNWNNAGTGWTLQTTGSIEGADVTVHSAPIANNPDGSDPVGRCQTDFDGNTGEVVGAAITLDSTENWGTSGANTYDPVKVLKHELGHAMRLTHSELGNLMDESVARGDHDRTPNLDDVDEAKEAYSSTRPVPEPRPEPGTIRIQSGSADLTAGAADYSQIGTVFGVPLAVYPMEGVMLPDPMAVPEGLSRVVVAAGIFPLESEFIEPAGLSLAWEEGAVSGLEAVGELHGCLLPPVDAAAMVPVCWVAKEDAPAGGSWQPVPAEVVLDLEECTGWMSVSGGGIYGLAAPAQDRPPVTGVGAFSDVTSSTESLVAGALTELRAMDIYRGYPDNTAQPDRNLTRLEFFTIAVRLGGGEEAAQDLSGTRPDFTDAIPAWGWGYVNQAVAMGLARGYPDGSFMPLQDVTGFEALAVLVRVLGPDGDAFAQSRPWPQGYHDAAVVLGLLDEIADLVTGDLSVWLAGSIDRGEMAVLTRAAAWTETRYSAEWAIVQSASIAAQHNWWRHTVQVAVRSSDGRRWVLASPVLLPESGRVDRLEVYKDAYLAPGADLPAAGQSAAVLGNQRTVIAILSVSAP